jgi:arylsulfatase A-like enzyme
MPDRQPNVIVLMSHDTGQHISPYGIPTVHTPHSERLTAEGVRFENSFCTSPLCSPSRAACFTGRYTHQNGVMGLPAPSTGLFDLYPEEKHAGQLFRQAGYESVLCGFLHEVQEWQRAGFELALNGRWNNNSTGDSMQHAAAVDQWLRARDKERPFYLQIGTGETHREWEAFDTPPDDSLGVWMPPYNRDLPEVRAEMAQFQGAVRRYDAVLGTLLDVVERHGLAEDTIFVSTTDHGIDMPRAKGTFYDPGIEVLLLMRYPAGRWGAGRVADEMVSNIDLLPTLLEACGLDVPANIEGRSFLPLLTGGNYVPNDCVFAEKIYHDSYDPTRAIRTERYKYIRFFEVCVFYDLRAATVPRTHYFPHNYLRRDLEELYDLQADPWELKNLAADPAHAHVLENLRRRVGQWMRATDDPLLRGPISSPYYAQKLQEFIEQTG